MADDWDDAMARGRAARGAEGRAVDRAKQDDRREDERRTERNAIASTSPLLAAMRRVTWSVGAVLTVALPMALMPQTRNGWWIGLAVIATLLPPVVWLLGRRQAPGRYAREQAWAAGLPFPVDGYLRWLGWSNDHPRVRQRDASVRIELAEIAGIDDAVDACRGLDPSLTISRRDDAIVIRGDQVLVNSGANHRYLRWTHRLVERVLRPLSAHRRIVRVEFE